MMTGMGGAAFFLERMTRKKCLYCVSEQKIYGAGPGWRKKFINGHNDVDDAKPYDVDYNDDVADADDVDKYDDDAGMPRVG